MDRSTKPEDETPSSARINRRTKAFRFLYDELPVQVQEAAKKAFALFLRDPAHASLRLHELKNNSKGQHLNGSFSVSIGKQYRAIYVVEGNKNIWYWIGTHAKYNHFSGKN